MITSLKNSLLSLAAFAAVALFAFDASAREPLPWQLNLQPSASTTMDQIASFHDMLLWIITAIAVFVMILLVYVIFRFNAKANPVPSKTTHNWTLEIAWITIPTLIVLFISLFSMRLLYFQDLQVEPDMTLKVTGYQWYWGYEYPDQDEITFNSYMIADADIDGDKGQRRLLSTDYPIVLPTDQVIQILMTAGDVLHSWTVPAFGVKIDAIPGRLNETWTKIKDPGVYYGQCSELCGKDHSYMPIEVWAVPTADYETWASAAEKDLDAANKALKAKMIKTGYKELTPFEQKTFKETFFPAPEISEEAKAIMEKRSAAAN